VKRIVIILLVVGTMMGCANTSSEEEGYRMSIGGFFFVVR
jgi:hypothetical protein